MIHPELAFLQLLPQLQGYTAALLLGHEQGHSHLLSSLSCGCLNAEYSPVLVDGCMVCLWHAGGGAVDIAANAQSLLEQSLLGELQSVVARALSGLDMFAGSQLSPFDLSPVDMRPAEVWPGPA